MAIATRTVIEACESAQGAARALATADTATKDRALLRLTELLHEREDEVLEAKLRKAGFGFLAPLLGKRR